jgi:sugar transferase (PEP-CTERM/EpsH1 system associated)
VKIVVVASRFPYPLEKGDKLRVFHQMRHMALAGHEVVLVAISDGPVPPEDLERLSFCSSVHVVPLGRVPRLVGVARALWSGRPLQVGYFDAGRVGDEVADVVAAERPDAVFCQLIRTAGYGRGLGVPTTIDYQDCFSAITWRRSGTAPWPLRAVMRREAVRIARYEHAVAEWFDRRVIISEQDRAALQVAEDEFPVDVVTNGVDTEYFRPGAVDLEPTADVCFIGNLGYRPNVVATNRLVREVLPRLRQLRPGTDVVLAGARPARSVLALAGDGVEVRGWVDDIRTAYASGRVMVAPLFTGAGQQNKVLEAMAMGMACVTSDLVNNAIGATPGEEIETATDMAEFADRTAALLADEERRAEMGRRARKFVTASYSWPVVTDRLVDILRGA